MDSVERMRKGTHLLSTLLERWHYADHRHLDAIRPPIVRRQNGHGGTTAVSIRVTRAAEFTAFLNTHGGTTGRTEPREAWGTIGARILILLWHYEPSTTMYVVWRRRAIATDRQGVLFPFRRVYDDEIKDAWKSIPCNHKGPGRVACLPILMLSERMTGKPPRQRILHRLPTVRSCCVGEPLIRAAFWHEYDFFAEHSWEWIDDTSVLMRRDGAKIRQQLRAVIPRPSAAQVRVFEAYRAEKVARAKEHAEQMNAAYHAARDQFRREKAEREEREAKARRETDDFWADFNRKYSDFVGGSKTGGSTFGGAGFAGSFLDCFAVLDLPVTATLADVKAHYRKLAMKHHPDKGGDEAEFRRVQAAYEQASRIVGGAA